MTDKLNGAPHSIEPKPVNMKFTYEQYLVVFACDCAGNMLANLANGLKVAKQLETATMMDGLLQHLAKYRDGYLRRTQTGLVIAGANEVPKLKG